MYEAVIQGVVRSVQDYGTIVIVNVLCTDDVMREVYFDHRSFGHVVEGEGEDNVLGREVEVIGESCEQTLRFLDEG